MKKLLIKLGYCQLPYELTHFIKIHNIYDPINHIVVETFRIITKQIGEDANTAGVIMPRTILLGARYYQEIAPNVALDIAEIIDTGEVIQTPSGDFSDTLITRETNPLEPDVAELKYYAAGIGLIQEEDLMLQHYGFIE